MIESIQWVLWFGGDLVFKWIPGTAVSLIESQANGTLVQSVQLPPITNPVTPEEIVHFLQINSLPSVYDQFFYWWAVVVAISIVLSLVFGSILIYCYIRMRQLHELEHEHLHALQQGHPVHSAPQSQSRWQRIIEEIHSESPQSWRLAILEADIVLAEVVDAKGFRGETLGDKLKTVDRSQFNTIDLAWEAHRFRNRIAHEGTLMTIEGREARRIISLYEKVFKEFGFIE